jgi:hypothetical protein
LELTIHQKKKKIFFEGFKNLKSAAATIRVIQKCSGIYPGHSAIPYESFQQAQQAFRVGRNPSESFGWSQLDAPLFEPTRGRRGVSGSPATHSRQAGGSVGGGLPRGVLGQSIHYARRSEAERRRGTDKGRCADAALTDLAARLHCAAAGRGGSARFPQCAARMG